MINVSANCLLHVFFGGPQGFIDALSPGQVTRLRLPNAADGPPVSLDDGDRQLLALLERDGRTDFTALAAATGRPATTLRRRLADLRASGALYFDVDFDFRSLGLISQTMLWLSVAPDQMVAAGRALASHPQVPFAARPADGNSPGPSDTQEPLGVGARMHGHVIAVNVIEYSNPFTRDRSDAPARWLLDILWLVLASGEDTNGEYSIIEQYMPVGSGPIPHIHPFEDEAFYILSGEMTAMIGGEKAVLRAGSLGHLPRNVVHEFEVTGTDVCHCLNFYTPAGFEQAILGCSRPAERRELPPPGLDALDSTQVVQFFNNYWVAPATLPWAEQKRSRG